MSFIFSNVWFHQPDNNKYIKELAEEDIMFDMGSEYVANVSSTYKSVGFWLGSYEDTLKGGHGSVSGMFSIDNTL